MICESQTPRVSTRGVGNLIQPFHPPTMHIPFPSPTGFYSRRATQDIPWNYILIFHADLPRRNVYT